MSINIGQVNEADVIKLAELMQQKEILIRDMRNAVKRITEDKTLVVDINLTYQVAVTPLRRNKALADAINAQSEWIIDRIYDTAIHSLENEIALLADKVMQNLVESNSRTITF